MNFEEEWLQKKWRPMVAMTYIVICSFDFVIFPIGWVVFLHFVTSPITPWNPVTLQGGGLFHLSFGAILGVSAFTRGQEKMARINNSSIDTPSEDDATKGGKS